MSLDSVALVGEVLSWIGLGVGLPVIVLARIVRASEDHWQAVDIVVIDQRGTLLARWFVAGGLHERPVRAREAGRIRAGWHAGKVDTRDSDRMRFGSPLVIGPTLSTLGIIFVTAGTIGFVASLLPLLS